MDLVTAGRLVNDELTRRMQAEEASPLCRAVKEIFEREYPLDRLVYVLRGRGRDGGLRASKPKDARSDGLIRYIWRMCRFHANIDPSMPVTATWDLSDWLDARGLDGRHHVFATSTEEGRLLMRWIDDEVVPAILERFGLDPMAGARRWGKALGMI